MIKTPLLRTLARALRLRCPACGVGWQFAGILRMNPRCEGCGLTFEPEQGYYVGAMYLNYGVTVAIGLLIALIFGTDENLVRLSYLLMGGGAVFLVFFFRYSRALWLALQRYVEAHTSEPAVSGEAPISSAVAPLPPPSAGASSASTRGS